MPLIGAAFLSVFLRPDKNKPPIWKRLVDSVVKPSSPNMPMPTDVVKLLPSLLTQLLRKPPPVSPDEPLPSPVSEPKSPQDLFAYILSLLALPNSTTTDVELIAPIEHHNDIASLVACANAVAVANPDFDITVTVNEAGVQVGKVKRVQPK